MQKSSRKYLFIAMLMCLATLAMSTAAPLSVNHEMSVTGAVQPPNWQLKLEFDRPVSVIEISKRISLHINGKPAKLKIAKALELGAEDLKKSLPPERTIFILSSEKETPASSTVSLKVGKGLYAADNKSFLSSDTRINFTVYETVKLERHEPFFYSKDNKGVFFDLSEHVRDHSLKNHVRVSPSIGYFTVDKYYHRSNQRYKITGKFITGQKYEIKLIGGELKGENKILESNKFAFAAKGPDPEIAFAADRSVIELKSRQIVPLTFTSVGDFKCQLMRIPAFFAPALESLTAFAEAEERRAHDLTGVRLSSEQRKAIASASSNLDNHMMVMVKQFEKLNAFAQSSEIGELKDFLKPGFTSTSKGFMGSENSDKPYIFSLPLDYREQPETGGAVVVNVSETAAATGQSACRLFQVTDLSITYKFSHSELLLWITSMESGKPVEGASIMLINQNGKSYFPGRSDKDGLLKVSQANSLAFVQLTEAGVESGREKFAISELIMAAAAVNDDSCFIKLNSDRFYSAAIAQSSPDQRTSLSSRGNIFTERGVYRPKETVFWKSTIRRYRPQGITAPANQMVRVIINSSKGEEIYNEKLQLNEFGTCSGSLELKSYFPLGQYNLLVKSLTQKELEDHEADDKSSTENESESLKSAPDPKWDKLMNRITPKTVNQRKPDQETPVLLTSTSFQVQEFEPPRHFVDISMEPVTRKTRQIVGRDTEQLFLDCKIKGLYYTGGPLRHAKVQWTAHLVEGDIKVSGFPHFHFGSNDIQKELIESGHSILNKEGELTVSIPVSQSVKNGLNNIEISATVLDVDARPATRVNRFSPKPDHRVGISRLPADLTAGQEFPLQIIVVDQNNRKIENGSVNIEIMRKRWFYMQKRDNDGGIYYSWSNGWVRNQRSQQQLQNGVAEFDLILAEGGDYMIQATFAGKNGEAKSALSFAADYSYSSFEDFNSRSRTRSESEIVLMPDKTVAAVNDQVRVRFSLPRPCKYALITKETDQILSARVIKLEKAQGEFAETMTELCRPNVFFSFIAPSNRGEFPLYAIDSDSEYPRSYFGLTSIKVQNKIDGLEIKIAPEQSDELHAAPGDLQSLQFKVTDAKGNPAHAEVAICVVDEAVLALTGFITPTLNSLTDFLLPLSVFSGDLRSSLISQELFKLISTRALTGGDGGSGSLASDLDARKDFRPVAFWHPALITDKDGMINIEFKLPDSMTSYRIYAVAADKNSAFASQERQLKVSREFYLEPGLPRFLVAGDKAECPVLLNNKGDKSGEATIKVAQATNLSAILSNDSTNLTPFTNSVVNVTLEADNGVGDAKLLMAGSFNGLSDAIERTIPVEPASTVLQRQLSGVFSGKKEIMPAMPTYLASMSSFELEGTIKARLNVSPTPWARIAPTLNYLMRYPYGCLEQTSSAIIPLAAMRTLILNGQIPGFSIEDVDKFLEAGINRLYKMQLSSGGFAYWPSDYSESWWGSQYATLALHVAKESGFAIDQVRLDSAGNYIHKALFKNKSEDRFSDGIMALAAVNLAMSRKLSSADLEVLKKKFINSGDEVEPIMLWAEALNGNTSVEELNARISKLKPASISVSRGWRYTPARHNAIALMAAVAAKADKKHCEVFVSQLLNSLNQNGYWNSTADTGIALFALARFFAARNAKPAASAEFTLITSKGEKQLSTGKHGYVIELDAHELQNISGIVIKTSEKTMLNYSLEYSYPDQSDRLEAIDEGFTVEKTFENINGDKEIRLGDLVKVTIEFEDQFRKRGQSVYLSHLALEDPIPAGFTAINSALKNDSLPPEAKQGNEEFYCDWESGAYSFYPDHREFRNEKLLAFKNRLWSSRFRLTYYLRASCVGTFKMKPTQVLLMYSPEIYGMTPTKTITVLPAR